MNNDEYQREANKTIPNDAMFEKNIKLEEIKTMNALMGLAGETGELIDIYKKVYFQGHSFDKIKVIKEVGDIMWYLNFLCQILDISFEEVMQTNINKLRTRYGETFSIEGSVKRVDEKI